MTKDNKNPLDILWAMALIGAGIGVFIRIPQVMPGILEMEIFAGSGFFIRLCFYLMGIILIGGGVRKLWYRFFKA
ncbi:hypothetical protein [Desulfobotulus sp.]|jgi:hypothetical protein|uniref:hypothetical protein n=1 Tax=Desulfobotulus sp. TaxID=1940337 RepID=UPI002A35DCD4|nr:hypothetical protein [Desulfobotulus sp.]MDY0161748.1 hypothetical protein [Desulfobotulus sp.]